MYVVGDDVSMVHIGIIAKFFAWRSWVSRSDSDPTNFMIAFWSNRGHNIRYFSGVRFSGFV
jgi:hypothetical protein